MDRPRGCVDAYAQVSPLTSLTRPHDNSTGQHGTNRMCWRSDVTSSWMWRRTGGSWPCLLWWRAVGGPTTKRTQYTRVHSTHVNLNMVAERHTTTATSDATDDQPRTGGRRPKNRPGRTTTSFHSRHDHAKIPSLLQLTTVEDDTDGTSEDYNVDTTTAATVSVHSS